MAGESENLHYIPGIGQWHDRLYADTDLFIPVLKDTITPGTPNPPFDTDKPAIGSFGGKQYQWNVLDQVWEPTGSGQGGSWSSNESFSS